MLHNHNMIIKHSLKAELQNLKRCKHEEEEKDRLNSAIQKKQKVNGVDSIANSEDLNIFFVSGSGEGLNCGGGGEVHSNSTSVELNGGSAKAPPLLRSSRGRVQMLPSKFNDSVLLDTWKNTNRRIKISELGFEGDNGSRDTEMRILNKGKENKCDSKQEIDYGFDEFNYEKHAESFKSIKTTVKGSRLLLVKKESENGLVEKAKKGKKIFKLEDFHLGDIVWAKCGKSYPAWPAVVIDPILHAPQSVLSCCVPGAICVMFFGYSKNGKQRVNFFNTPLCKCLSY